MLIPGNRSIFPLSGAGFRILVPLQRLKAGCRNRAPRIFLSNCGHLAQRAGRPEIMLNDIPDLGDGFIALNFMLC